MTDYTLLPVLTAVLAVRNEHRVCMYEYQIRHMYVMYTPEGRQYLEWKRTPTKKTSKTGWDLQENYKSWSRDSAGRISQTRKSAWASISVSFCGCSGTAVVIVVLLCESSWCFGSTQQDATGKLKLSISLLVVMHACMRDVVALLIWKLYYITRAFDPSSPRSFAC